VIEVHSIICPNRGAPFPACRALILTSFNPEKSSELAGGWKQTHFYVEYRTSFKDKGNLGGAC